MDSELLKHSAEKLKRLGVWQSDLDALKDICRQYSISDKRYVTLVGFVIELAEFKKIHKPKMRTGVQKKKALECVRDAANALQVAIRNLDLDSALILDGFLEESDLSEADCNPLDLRFVKSALHSVEEVQQASEKALVNMRERSVDKPGRIKTLEIHAGIVGLVAVALKVFAIAPGDGGPFRHICDALFDAAGAGGTSQGAIKHFQKNLRPMFKSAGGCL